MEPLLHIKQLEKSCSKWIENTHGYTYSAILLHQ